MNSFVRQLRYYADEARIHYLLDFAFIHINKTGGSSIERALNLPFRHRTAQEMRQKMGARRWERCFSFTIVRNPWDKVASHYRYRVQTNQTGLADRPISFTNWVEAAYGEQDPAYYDAKDMFMPQVEWVCDEQGRVLVDYIGRFERLEADFQVICQHIRREAKLPHLKRSGRADYRAVYSDRAAEIVARVFARDLELFGYSFDIP